MSRLATLRANDGSSTIACDVITLPSEASLVLSCAAAASTMTVVEVEPTFSNLTFTVAGVFTSSSML